MRRISLVAATVVVASLAAGAAFSQDTPRRPTDELGYRVALLEKELGGTRARIALLERRAETDVVESRALLDALDRVEAEGFVPGMNWKSRETLLGSLRQWLAEHARELPPPPPAEHFPLPGDVQAK